MPSAEQLAPGQHAFSTTREATLTYFVKGTGPLLVVNVAPGWGAASVVYQNGFRYLEDDVTFVHLEPRGTRGSSFPEDRTQMSSWHMSDDVEELRLHLSMDQLPALMGHSNGAAIALWYAIRYPKGAQKVVLLNAQLLGSEAVSAPATKAVLDRRPDKDAVDAFYNYDPPTITTDAIFGARLGALLSLYVANPARDLEKFKTDFANTPQSEVLQAQFRAEAQHPNQVDQLGNVVAQTLVIIGRDDYIVPVPVSEMIAAGIRGSILKIVEDCGHITWIEQKQQFAQLLLDFLRADSSLQVRNEI